jgi:hypothetical protein
MKKEDQHIDDHIMQTIKNNFDIMQDLIINQHSDPARAFIKFKACFAIARQKIEKNLEAENEKI